MLCITIKTPEHFENSVDYITQTIQELIWLPGVKTNKNGNRLWYPNYILQKIKHEKKAKAQWQKYETAESKWQLN